MNLLNHSRPFFVVALLLTCVPGMTGCSRRAPDTSPPVVHMGEDVCHACGMILSDERYACAVVWIDNNERNELLYDDIGEMLHDAKALAKPGAKLYVRDVDSLEWLDATRAWFVQSDELMTPMATGFAACKTRAQADALAAKHNGKVLSFEQATTP